jgi:GH15 family glucan-1,4-alpha-glucosidase
MTDDYLPIENYGVIGDLNTVALVGLNGSIDFFCYPHFDSPSVFARLLDINKGGYYSISPQLQNFKKRQMYLPDTNVLLTRFLSNQGIVEMTDCMPVRQQGPGMQLIRIVKSIKGENDICMRCAPRFNYGRSGHTYRQTDERRIEIIPDGEIQPTMLLYSEIPMTIEGDDIVANFNLKEGFTAHFHLVWASGVDPQGSYHADNALRDTIDFWHNWIASNNYEGRWRETVIRSALVLKLLTSYKYGALVAAPTFGLPEAIGGGRNWDYRYCWIRDSSFTIYALVRLGFRQEAIEYIRWIEERFKAAGPTGQLQLMYRLDGDPHLEETNLDHWEGYRRSAPVRIGNAASKQHQLDIYGELLDAVHMANEHVQGVTYDGWKSLSHTVDFVCEHWREPDHGIWEIRGEQQHFLHSRLMCWVALDRAIRLARNQSLPAPFVRWSEQLTTIHNSIYEDFWNDELKSFVQIKGGNTVDASVLMMPMVRFITSTDPRWLSTLELVGRRLATDTLLQRYESDHITFEEVDKSQEGSFTMCCFWYIECLARAGQVDRARFLFEKMLGYANHLGLYAEELGLDGSHLGNFPQAFTHLALISAAYAIDLKLDVTNEKGWRF